MVVRDADQTRRGRRLGQIQSKTFVCPWSATFSPRHLPIFRPPARSLARSSLVPRELTLRRAARAPRDAAGARAAGGTAGQFFSDGSSGDDDDEDSTVFSQVREYLRENYSFQEAALPSSPRGACA